VERLFVNFELNSEFFIILGLFLTIAFIIAIIIVLFVNRINTLRLILDQAKEIDEAKSQKISELEAQLQQERIDNANLKKELEYFSQGKEKFKAYKEQVDKIQSTDLIDV